MLGFSLVASGSASVIACGGGTHNPSATAQTESKKLDNKTVDLTDQGSPTTTYEGKTAQTDASAIQATMVKEGIVTTAKEASEFTFDKSTKLNAGPNNNIGFTVNAPDGTTAKGTFNVDIKTDQAASEAAKVQGKTVDLTDQGSPTTTYEGKTAQTDASAIQAAMVKEGIVTTAKEASEFSFDNSTKLNAGPNNNIGFTVNAPDGTTASGTFNVDIKTDQAASEAAKLQGKTVDLTDTSSTTYEGKTAQTDASAIRDAMVAAGIVTTAKEASEFSFDNSTKLNAGKKPNNISFTVKALDGSTASGTFNVAIKAYNPIAAKLDKILGSYKSQAKVLKMDAALKGQTASKTTDQKIINSLMTWLPGDHPSSITSAAALSAWNTNSLSLEEWSHVHFNWSGAFSNDPSNPTKITVTVDNGSATPITWGTLNGYAIYSGQETVSYEGALLHHVVDNGSAARPNWQGTYDLTSAQEHIDLSNNPAFKDLSQYKSTNLSVPGYYLNTGNKSQVLDQAIEKFLEGSSYQGTDIWQDLFSHATTPGNQLFMYAGGNATTGAKGELIPGQYTKVALGTITDKWHGMVWTTFEIKL